MGFLTRPYRISYIAKNFRTGLTNIIGAVFKPDGTTAGVYPLVEMPSPFLGVYYFDFLTSTSDPEGEYFAIIASPTDNIKDIKRVSLYKGQPSPTVLAGLNAIEGRIFARQVTGNTLEQDDIVSEVENKTAQGKVHTFSEIVGIVIDDDIEGET